MPASHAICRYVLRTTNADAARAFYTAVLGHDRATIVPLHEQALARGARPHWLGQIEVADVDAAAAAFVELGAERLGPIVAFPDGRTFTVLRDPGGAVVSVTSEGVADEAPLSVAWHQLNTTQLDRVVSAYTTLFGWRLTARTTHPEHGVFHHFAWAHHGADAGAFTDIADLPGRHPHWLFHLRVVDLDRAIARVRAERGTALGPFALPDGERVVVCDDPQGAAFALRG
jgi:predicted enzyme related to lactoylglutathione lyase